MIEAVRARVPMRLRVSDSARAVCNVYMKYGKKPELRCRGRCDRVL